MKQLIEMTNEVRELLEASALFYELIDSDKDIDQCRLEFLERYPNKNDLFEDLLKEEMQ